MFRRLYWENQTGGIGANEHLLMSFSMVCVGQEAFLQAKVFNFPFQRAGVLNSHSGHVNKVIHLYLAPLFCWK